MAGSLQHILDGWSLIENMGDAYEATEELMWLILYDIGEERAKMLLDKLYYPMARGELDKNNTYLKVQELMTK